MSKLTTKGFTDYFGDVTEIEILSYDNNKYVKIRKPDGTVEEIKRGYILADKDLKRHISAVNWHIHGGGNRRNFKPRNRTTTFDAWVGDTRHSFRNKAGAVSFASRIAKTSGKETNVRCTVSNKGKGRHSFIGGYLDIECTPSGLAVQYGGRGRRTRGSFPKYLRKYGKVLYGTLHLS